MRLPCAKWIAFMQRQTTDLLLPAAYPNLFWHNRGVFCKKNGNF
jgi:hypothetical protein